MKFILYLLAPLCKSRAKVLEFCLLSLFKGLRQTNQNSAHKRRIIKFCIILCMAFSPASREDRMAT